MKEKVIRVLKLLAYPAFYGFCLLLFGYLTFPFDRLKDRVISEIGKQSKGKAPVVTMEHLDSYWLTGVEVENAKVHLPADEAASTPRPGLGAFGMPAPAKSEPEKPSVIEIKEAHARARILPLLLGRVQVDFWASVFGGEVSGSAPAGSSKGDVELKIEDVLLSEIAPLQSLLGVPIDGKVNGSLSLSPTDGKFSKATGKVDVSIKSLVVSDGKTKIQGLLAIPPAKVDEIVLTGEAEKGVLKITKLTANGPDLELDGDGKINLREQWGESSVDLYIKFRFTDAYRGKDGTTKSILGEPGSTGTPLIESTVPKLKKAKRADGFYGFHVHGKIKKLEFTPSSTDASGSSGTPSPTKKGAKPDSPLSPGGGRKVGGVTFPLGASSASPSDDEREKEREREKEKREREAKEREEKASDDRRGATPMPMPFPAAPPPRQEPPTEEPGGPPNIVPPGVGRPGDNTPPSDGPPPGDNPPGVAPPGDQQPPSDQPQPPTEEQPR